MSNIYNHRSLVPAAAAVQPAPPQASSARLADLLDFVKHEFDVIGSDANQLKGQRDDFEHRSESPRLRGKEGMVGWMLLAVIECNPLQRCSPPSAQALKIVLGL